MDKPFKVNGPTTTLSVTTSNTQGTLSAQSDQVLVQCVGGTAFISFGFSAQTAAVASSTPLQAGSSRVFTVSGANYVAAICGTGTATVYITPGTGL